MASKLSLLGVSGKLAPSTWWNLDGDIASCVAAYQPIGAASYAASKVNLANPGTHDATEGVAPDWTASNGWDFSGNWHLETGVIPSSGWSFIVRYSNATKSTAVIFGESTTTDALARVQIYPYYTNDNTYYRNGGQSNIADFDTAAVLCMAGNKAYRDGVDEGLTIPDWSGTAISLYIGASNSDSGAAANRFAGKIQAIAMYNVNLTSDQISALTTAMNAL